MLARLQRPAWQPRRSWQRKPGRWRACRSAPKCSLLPLVGLHSVSITAVLTHRGCSAFVPFPPCCVQSALSTLRRHPLCVSLSITADLAHRR